jgi:hypothetical protein
MHFPVATLLTNAANCIRKQAKLPHVLAADPRRLGILKIMKINKSSGHAKITGDFGESLILYWLSKYGFECALVDHTGIDIIAVVFFFISPQ